MRDARGMAEERLGAGRSPGSVLTGPAIAGEAARPGRRSSTPRQALTGAGRRRLAVLRQQHSRIDQPDGTAAPGAWNWEGPPKPTPPSLAAARKPASDLIGERQNKSREQQVRLGCWLGSPPSHEARDRARVFPRRPTGAAQLSGGHGSRCGGLNGCSRRTRGCRSRRRRWPQPRSRRSAAGAPRGAGGAFGHGGEGDCETLDGWRPEQARQVWLTRWCDM